MSQSLGQYWVIETPWGVRTDAIYYSKEGAESALAGTDGEKVRLVDFIVIRH